MYNFRSVKTGQVDRSVGARLVIPAHAVSLILTNAKKAEKKFVDQGASASIFLEDLDVFAHQMLAESTAKKFSRLLQLLQTTTK